MITRAAGLALALLLTGCATATVIRDGRPETVLCERDLKTTPWSGWDLLAIPAIPVYAASIAGFPLNFLTVPCAQAH